jgi:trigger factor
MKIEVENQPNCVATLRVEIPPERVSKAWEDIAREYVQHARIPGYRPGKAPRTVVESKFKAEIREELTRKLLSDSCREAISEKHLHVLSLAEVKDVELTEDKRMRFSATFITAPEFELPNYKEIPVQEEQVSVSDQEISDALDQLRDQHAEFVDVTDRALQMEDYAVIDYTGTIDGKPVGEVVPNAGKPLSGTNDFWVKMTPDAFFPGFCEKLTDAHSGDRREFAIEVPADFGVKELAGQKIQFAVTIKGIKQKQVPDLNDAFAGKIAGGKTMEELRDLVKHDLEHQKEHAIERSKRKQIMDYLLSQVECELPAGLLRRETRRILGDIVRENQVRGVTEEMLKESEQELIGAASQNARERVKGTFILLRIAEAEKMEVSREEFANRIATLARYYQMTPDKLLKELEKHNAADQVREEVLVGKVLDFLSANAKSSLTPSG